jgi:hypothetical protein
VSIIQWFASRALFSKGFERPSLHALDDILVSLLGGRRSTVDGSERARPRGSQNGCSRERTVSAQPPSAPPRLLSAGDKS